MEDPYALLIGPLLKYAVAVYASVYYRYRLPRSLNIWVVLSSQNLAAYPCYAGCLRYFLIIFISPLHNSLICFNANYRRGSGGRGFISGAGETELELQRRRFVIQKSFLSLFIYCLVHKLGTASKWCSVSTLIVPIWDYVSVIHWLDRQNATVIYRQAVSVQFSWRIESLQKI